MPDQSQPARRSVVFLFTTFPVTTETFLQREVRALRKLSPFPTRIVSLFRGDSEFEGLPVQRFSLVSLIQLIWWIPYWLFCNPRGLCRMIEPYFSRPPPNGINFWESGLGLGYALCTATRWKLEAPGHFHAVWASAPATAARALNCLLEIPYSFGAHAYDLFEDGGDWILSQKIQSCRFVRTSTLAGKARLKELGCPDWKVAVVRRGLNCLPPWNPDKKPHQPLRLLSVGRMVEKMGYPEQLLIYRNLVAAGLDFTVDIYGSGALDKRIHDLATEYGINHFLTFHGAQPYEVIEQAYQRADIFLFTGRIDRRGDRAGLPNAVAEAMAWGVPVVAFSVGAVAEAVENGVTGRLVTQETAVAAILELTRDLPSYQTLRINARQWCEREYEADENMRRLAERISREM